MSLSDQEPSSRLIAALEAAGDMASSWDLDGDRLDWSGRFPEALTGFAEDLTSGRRFAGRIHPDDLVHRQLMLANHFDRQAAFDCEYRVRGSCGIVIWLQERGRAQRDEAGRPQKMLGIIRAIGERKARQSRLEQLANYDELTGHFNKSRLREAVDQIIAANQRTDSPAAFLSVGIDNMTMINDLFGYQAADTVLIEIGRRLDSCLRVSDLIGRLGGDRFGIVLSLCPPEDIQTVAEKILAVVNSASVMTSRGPIYATVSIGGAASGPDAVA